MRERTRARARANLGGGDVSSVPRDLHINGE